MQESSSREGLMDREAASRNSQTNNCVTVPFPPFHGCDPCPDPLVAAVGELTLDRRRMEMLIVRQGVRVECFATASAFLSRPRAMCANCLLLDVHLPDMCGLELQSRLAVERSETPVIFVTECVDIPTIVCAMKAGAMEYLVQPVDDEVLRDVVAQAIERSREALESANELQLIRTRYATLTKREREVMALVVSGLLNKQVASELELSEITVKAHRGSLMRKMRARSLPMLVHMAARLDNCTATAPKHPLPPRPVERQISSSAA